MLASASADGFQVRASKGGPGCARAGTLARTSATPLDRNAPATIRLRASAGLVILPQDIVRRSS
jgi:hypothetical protein